MPREWISRRCQRTGGNLRSNPAKQRKGPLRKIVGYESISTDFFSRSYVVLECGHKVFSDGMYKARCNRCLEENKKASGPG